jgi:hypothetical protein
MLTYDSQMEKAQTKCNPNSSFLLFLSFLEHDGHMKQQEPSEIGAGAPAMLATIGSSDELSSWDCRTSVELMSYLFFLTGNRRSSPFAL